MHPLSTLKEAFRLNLIKLEDFWRSVSCDEFWQSFRQSPHPSVATLAAKVQPGLRAFELPAGQSPLPGQETIQVFLKARAVDPPVLTAAGAVPLSQLDGEFAELLAAHWRRQGPKEYVVENAA